MTNPEEMRLTVPGEKTLTMQRRGIRPGRRAGTTLIEILVVIVVFLIGILAVVQIFPGGFRILLTTRNNSAATQLGRDEVERLKARPDLIPEDVLSVDYSTGTALENGASPDDLGPQGEEVDGNGRLLKGGSTVVASNWQLAAGPNVFRHIVGEGQRVPAPRTIRINNSPSGAITGGVMVLDHGPIDPGTAATTPRIVAYANDLSRTVGAPREAAPVGAVGSFPVQARSADGGTVLGSVPATLTSTPVSTAPFEFFVTDPSTSEAAILVPTAARDRVYRVRFSAYLLVGSVPQRYDFVALSLGIPAVAQPGPPLVRIRLNDLLAATTNAMPAGATLASVELDTIRLAPQYRRLNLGSAFSGDPFEMQVFDPKLGVLLFTPAARGGVVTRPGGASEPLIAKVDYDVLDWRVIREDFRATEENPTFRLALQSLMVGQQAGPDGRPNGGLPTLEATNGPTDNLIVQDLTTGCPVLETASLVTADKSRGTVTLNDSNVNVAGTQIRLIEPSGDIQEVDAANRTFRVLYRARQQWAVQLLKSASQYSILFGSLPSQGQCLVGGGAAGGLKTRLYFPRGDANRKVTVDSITYQRSDGTLHTIEGQDLLIRPARTGDPIQLPSADLSEIDSAASTFDSTYGFPVRGVKGASVAVRVLWNPDSFSLTNDTAQNMRRLDIWGRGWRRSTTETFLRAEETR